MALGLRAPIILTFSESMDRDSVVLRFEPEVDYRLQWEGPRGALAKGEALSETVVIEHEAFRPASVYRLILESGLGHAGGAVSPAEWIFFTEDFRLGLPLVSKQSGD